MYSLSSPSSRTEMSIPNSAEATAAAAAPAAGLAVADEIPLEILDYSCTNVFEEVVKEVETFLVETFQTRSELGGFLFTHDQPADSSLSSSPSSSSSAAASNSLISSSSLLSFPSEAFAASSQNGEKVRSRAALAGSAAHAQQHGRGAAAQPLTGPVTIGKNFPLGRRQGTDPALCVEVHVFDYQHPIGRQFYLPLFLLIKSAAQQSTYDDTESAYYLSILTTAVGGVFGPELDIHMNAYPQASSFPPPAFACHAQPSIDGGGFPLPSPHRHPPNCVPCFAPIGDLFKQTFIGCSPPIAPPLTSQPERSTWHAATADSNALWALWGQPTFTAQFRSSAYGQAPAGCQYLSDFLDLFQLHIGQRSRVQSEDYGGMSVSVWKRFHLAIPWRFRLHNAIPHTGGRMAPALDSISTRATTTSWSEALDKENEALLVLCGPQTHPFGTNAAPLESVIFDFQWSQLQDVEAQENASRSYLDPFALSSTPSGKEVNRKCSITARAVVQREDDLRHTATQHIRGFVDALLERARTQAERKSTAAPVTVSQRAFTMGQGYLETHINAILMSSLQGASAQEALLNSLRSQDDGVSAGSMQANDPARLQERVAQLMDLTIAGGRSKASATETRCTTSEANHFRDLRRAYFPGSLLSRVAYLCVEEESRHRLVAEDVYVLWQGCVAALKRRVEREGSEGVAFVIECLALPVSNPAVDVSQPILAQKLQMLAYCLRAMMLQGQSGSRSGLRNPTDGWDESSQSFSEEYQACKADDAPASTPANMAAAAGDTALVCDPLSGTLGWASSASTLRRQKQLRLITNGEPLVVPPSLPRPPVTSDILLQRAQKMNELGASAIAQAARTWLQSDSLYNDMCLFQHLNQVQSGRVVRFPDFIQWYSPRDFHPPPGGTPSANDNDYLSPRMQSREDGSASQVWTSLWKRAAPRSKEQIIADSFRPAEEAALVFRWLEKDMTEATLLLEVANASVANTLHRLLCHRVVMASPAGRSQAGRWSTGSDQDGGTSVVVPAVRSYVKQRCTSLTASLDAASALLVGLPQVAPFSVMEFESVATMYATALRETNEIETAISAAVALECLLGKANPAIPESGELIRGLASPSSEQNDLTRLALESQSVSLRTWTVLIADRFTESDSRTPRQMRARLTCVAERPLNTAECFQQLTVERLATGVLRLALTLTQEAV